MKISGKKNERDWKEKNHADRKSGHELGRLEGGGSEF